VFKHNCSKKFQKVVDTQLELLYNSLNSNNNNNKLNSKENNTMKKAILIQTIENMYWSANGINNFNIKRLTEKTTEGKIKERALTSYENLTCGLLSDVSILVSETEKNVTMKRLEEILDEINTIITQMVDERFNSERDFRIREVETVEETPAEAKEIMTKEELIAQLASIGSTNISFENLTDITTGEQCSERIIDNDRQYYWIIEPVEADKYKCVASGSLLF